MSGRRRSLLAAALTAVMATGMTLAPQAALAGRSGAEVAFLVPNGIDPRWQADAITFVRTLDAHAPGTSWIVLNAHDHETTQIEQAKEAITGGTRVLVVSPVNPDAAGQIVAYARPRGVTVIAYDRPIEARHLPLFVGYDPVAVGRLQGQYLLSHVVSGWLVIVNGPATDDLARSQYDGLEATLSRSRGSFSYRPALWTPAWSASAGRGATRQGVFELGPEKRPAAIVTQSDVLASGAIEELRTLSGVRAVLTGAGSSLLGLRAVLAGNQTMTVFEPGETEAEAAAGAAASILAGSRLPKRFSQRYEIQAGTSVRSALFRPVLVTAKTLQAKLVRTGLLSSDANQWPMNVEGLCAGMTKICHIFRVRAVHSR